VRKLIFIGCVALGALVGLLAAANDDWATRVVMMMVGALFGSAIGGALVALGRRTSSPLHDNSNIPGMGFSTEDIAANYWRDRGHPPFMKPPDAVPDKHMFDPEKLG
jgi:hypothetical protein